MKKAVTRLPILLVCLFIWLSAKAQITPPCSNPPPTPATACGATCVYCNIDGYSGSNAGSNGGGQVCAGAITMQNPQWFGFIAGTSTISINVATSSCTVGNGMQAAFFDACGGDALNCNGGTAGGQGQPLIVTHTDFTPGQVYYLLIDGYIGDVCDYTIEVIDGSTTVPPPGPPGPISGPTEVCPGATAVYSIPPVDNAGQYLWSGPPGSYLNGTGGSTITIPASQGGTQVTVVFGGVGGNVCVNATNQCNAPQQPTCLPVTVAPLPATILPDLELCPEDLPYQWTEAPNTPVVAPGTYNFTSIAYDNFIGCDSFVKQKIVVRQLAVGNLGPKYVCEGSCFDLNGTSYCTAGSYEVELDGAATSGCDSTVRFTIVQIPVSAVIPTPDVLTCADPVLTLTSTGSVSGGGTTYQWLNASGTSIGTNSTVDVGSAGIYKLILSSTVGGTTCRDTAQVTVLSNGSAPVALATGDTITCAAGNTIGMLQGGSDLPSMIYKWSGPGITPANENFQNPEVTELGDYVVTVTNPTNGCSATATATLTNNLAVPTLDVLQKDTLTCAQPSLALSLSVSAGFSALKYHWTGPDITPANEGLQNPTVGQTGTYYVTVTNPANSCTAAISTQIFENKTPPFVTAGPDQELSCFQPNVNLQGDSPGNAVVWAGNAITPVSQNEMMPNVWLSGTYVITATNPENGCTRTDTAIVSSIIAFPTAKGGPDQTLTCAKPALVLNGGGSTQGPGFTATWTGPDINASNEHYYSPTVTMPGTYTLTVLNTANGCTATDEVIVGQNVTAPFANAGPNLTITCATLSGVSIAGTGFPASVTFFWTGPGIGAHNENLQIPSVSVPGTYTLVVTNPANGCTGSDVMIVTQDASVPIAFAGNDQSINCMVKSVTISGLGSSSGPGVTYSWTGPGGFTSNQISPPGSLTTPGTYTLKVTTPNGCDNTDVAVVYIDTIKPNIFPGAPITLNCFNGKQDTLLGTIADAGSNYTLTWTGPGITPAIQHEPKPTITEPGIYYIFVTDTLNGCTNRDSVQVFQDAVLPAADAGLPQTITCINPLVILGGPKTDQTPDFIVIWDGPGITPSNINDPFPKVLVAGEYIMQVINTTNSCVQTDTVLVGEDLVYPIASAGADTSLNCRNLLAQLDGSGSSSGLNVVYTWAGPGIQLSEINLQSPSVSTPGQYFLAVADTVNGCVSTDDVLIEEDFTQPFADAGPDIVVSCSQINNPLDGSASHSNTGNPFSYTWIGPGINTLNVSLAAPAVTDSGTYILLITDLLNHCTATDTAHVELNGEFPNIDAGPTQTLTCALDTVSLDASMSASGPNITYLWNGPGIVAGQEMLQNPQVFVPGFYGLTVTDTANGCSRSAVASVEFDYTPPVANANDDLDLTCASPLVTLSVGGSSSSTGGANFSILWEGPGIDPASATLPNPVVAVPGTYTLTIFDDQNGCSATDWVAVNPDQSVPAASAGPDKALNCTFQDAVLEGYGVALPGVQLAYFWAGPGITAANQTEQQPQVSVPGIYTISVTNVATNCTATDIVVVGQDFIAPPLTVSSDIITCDNLVGHLLAESDPDVAYYWEGPGITFSNYNELAPSVTEPGNYTVTVTGLNGCTASASVFLAKDANVPEADAEGATLNCFNLGQATLSAEILTPDVTIEWTGPNGFVSNETDPIVTEAGEYTLNVVGQNDCAIKLTVLVGSNFNVPAAQASVNDKLDCNSNAVIINGFGSSIGGQYFYFWSGGHILSGAETLHPEVDSAAVYILTVLDQISGCTAQTSVTVEDEANRPTGMAVVAQSAKCTGADDGSVSVQQVFGGTAPYVFTLNGDATSSSGVFNLLAAGVYYLVAEDANGCMVDTVFALFEPDPLDLDLGPDLTLNLGDSARIKANWTGTAPIQSATWLPVPPDCPEQPCLEFGITPLATMQFQLTLVDSNGCTARDAILLKVEDQRGLYVANALLIGDAEANGLLFPQSNGKIVRNIRSFRIFDRWGEAVFEQFDFLPDDPARGWDGSVRGSRQAQPGVYVWWADVEFIDGQTKRISGDVTVVRQ